MIQKFSMVLCFVFLLLLSQLGFAKSLCYQGFTGADVFFVLNGGKPNVKPFAGMVFVPNAGNSACVLPAWATILTDSAGVDHIALTVNYDPIGGCGNAQATGIGDAKKGFAMSFDNAEDGAIDGTFTVNKINCSSVPPLVQKQAENK